MNAVYLYVLDTLADWEIGYVTSELNSGRFFKNKDLDVSLKTVSHSKKSIKTMGGLTITPDCLIDDIVMSDSTVLLLPGATTWEEQIHMDIIKKSSDLLSIGATVCAICGATAALANYGLLDETSHTSNGPGYLDMLSPSYKGRSYYVDEPSVASNNLITANSTGGLLWAKQIIKHLGVFNSNTLESWYNYFSTGDASHFFALMQSLPSEEV